MSTTTSTTDRTQWLADRKLQLGASDVAAVIGVSPWSTPWQVWAEKTGRLDDWEGNENTRLGQRFEAAVLDEAEHQLGDLERNVRIVHDALPLAATLDGRVIATGEPVEAKCTGLLYKPFGDWGEPGTDEVPEYYLVQVHTQLIITAQEMGFLFALIAGRGVVRYEVTSNAALHDRIANICADWWHKHITLDQEPSRESAVKLDVVKRLRKVADKTIAFGNEELELIRQREELKQVAKVTKDRIEATEAKLLMALGDAEAANVPDGSELTYFEQSRKGYMVQPCSYRVLRIKRAK